MSLFAKWLFQHNPQSSSVFAKYPSDCDFGGRRVLNLGCGHALFTHPNVINLDAEDCSGANVIWDLSQTPMPFENETFDFIIANHILEHVPNWWNCFEDCARILKTGGFMEIWLPGDGGSSQLGYRDHINVINHCSFWGTYAFYRNPNNAWATANNGGASRQMKLQRTDIHLVDRRWIRLLPHWAKLWAIESLRNVVYESGFFFKKLPIESLQEYDIESGEVAYV